MYALERSGQSPYRDQPVASLTSDNVKTKAFRVRRAIISTDQRCVTAQALIAIHFDVNVALQEKEIIHKCILRIIVVTNFYIIIIICTTHYILVYLAVK